MPTLVDGGTGNDDSISRLCCPDPVHVPRVLEASKFILPPGSNILNKIFGTLPFDVPNRHLIKNSGYLKL
jgi:hypothetical protein